MIQFYIFDIECDGLLEDVTKIHCLSYSQVLEGKIVESKTLTNYKEIVKFFKKDGYFVGHNIIRYDIPVLEKILCVKLNIKVIDTLNLSWYLYPYLSKTGLEFWGKSIGIEKPHIEDWDNQSLSDYIHRCESDVKINTKIFKHFLKYLMKLYKNFKKCLSIIGYLNFKYKCLYEQEIRGLKLDEYICKKTLEDLNFQFQKKTDRLKNIMPPNIGNIIKKRPVKTRSKDGGLNRAGQRWFLYIKNNNLPEDTTEIRDRPNPGSTNQLKEWLYSLGWKPETFKENKNGENIPQISLPFGAGLCNSVKILYNKEPNLKELDNYYKIRHRLNILKGFLENVDDKGRIYSTAHGFTNTLRLAHKKPIVNLPSVDKLYGKEIRSCIKKTNNDYIMFGSDLSSLEDSTKQHYIYFFDPEYVKELRHKDFDPHIDIGVLSNLITKEEEILFKKINNMDDDEKKKLSNEDKELYKSIKSKRHIAKTTNFSATYGAGGDKIAKTAKISLKEGLKLHKIYWERNSAIKKVVKNVKIKKVNKQKWIFNPVSKIWLFLKSEKDIFSTLNSSTGVYFFDFWVKEVRKRLEPKGIYIGLQYHDEILGECLVKDKKFVEQKLKEAIVEANKKIRLNVEIGLSIDWGNNYADCH